MIEDTMFDNDYYVVFLDLEKEHEKGETSERGTEGSGDA